LDASLLRYAQLMSDLIDSTDLRHVKDFRSFARVIYPTIQVNNYFVE